MKTITIDIADHVYKKFRDFLDLLPNESFRIYDEDPDGLTVSEEKEIYTIRNKNNNGNMGDFSNWDEIKDGI
jgi:hypothetical protein